MLTAYLDVPVGRRTNLSMAYDDQWRLQRTEKLPRNLMEWARQEGHSVVRVWIGEAYWIMRLVPDKPYENPFDLAE